jgi:hypothetical protein
MIKRFAHTTTYGQSPLCTGKGAYDTQLEADNARKFRQPHERERLWAYKCQHPSCPYWHLSRKQPPKEWTR